MFGKFGVPGQPAIVLIRPDGKTESILGAADDALLDTLIEQALT